jgi:eukaryotic-like serine/threonine-protein kinase
MSFIREPDAEPIPGYRLIEPLGSGGFGEAWKCEAPGGLFKAIKFVFGNLNSLDMEGARAEQELHALQRVKEVRHPFVLSMDRIEVVEGELVIVMELADRSLHDKFVEAQQAGLVGVPRDELLRYLRDAAEALDHMNERHNLQHLDIKPRNLFLVCERVKVADFGLVKHLERASASGIIGGVTPLYAAPETFGGKISGTTDQYSLAIVYQEMLTGQRPFNGKNARLLAQQHLQDEPELRALPEAERAVVARALAKDPGRRYPNCLAFIRALYTARTPARSDIVLPATPATPSAPAKPLRGKTMADTMEDIPLEQLSAHGPLSDHGPGPGPLPEDDADWESLPEPEEKEELSKLGITVAQPQTGSLRPTVVIGVGSFGRRALLELRCRFLDRFGSLDKVPLLRFLYLDSDPEAVKAAIRGAAEVAFNPNEIYHLPLQPVAHYRRRQLEQLADWLPREKLYTMPRNLKTQGSRALGRLAFTDNYLRLLTRLRREIQQSTHPDAIYQSVTQTGLALRDNTPRVYVVAAATGGGSGFLVDLGFVVRRLLHQLRHVDSPVSALLCCGAPDDPATPAGEQANIYATLTELNHFTDPVISFSAQYGIDGPAIRDNGQPFDCAYLLPLAHRTPNAVQEVVTHLGSYLFHELTTPLGLRLDQVRKQKAQSGEAGLLQTPFRSLGTYAVWFPRGLLLRLAARTACLRLLDEWVAGGGAGGAPSSVVRLRGDGDSGFSNTPVPEPESPEVEAVCARALADPGLRPEALAARIEELARGPLEALPAEALTRLLGGLEEQSQQFVAQDDPGSWARQALTRVREWLGPGLAMATGTLQGGREMGDWRKSRLNRALEVATQQAAQEWTLRLSEAAARVMELPGRRIASAEAALARLIEYGDEMLGVQQERQKQQAQRVQQAQAQLQTALENCLGGAGAFSFFGGRPRRQLRLFMDHMAAFARQCLAEDMATALQLFYTGLSGRLRDRLRDLSFCRQRLRGLQEQLTIPEVAYDEAMSAAMAGDRTPGSPPPPTTETFWEAIRQSATTRVVLPLGETDLERAASRFMDTLNGDHWAQLDQALQDRVLGPLGGMHQALLNHADLNRSLLAPLLDQAAQYLGELLPVTDVAQVLIETNAGDTMPTNLADQVREYNDCAAPLIDTSAARVQAAERGSSWAINAEAAEKDKAADGAFLLVPASEAGKAYSEVVRQAFPQLQVVRVPGQAALMFCREQGWLSMEDLQQVLGPCRRAYEESASSPVTSPHARCDIVDWIPLDP